MKNVILLICFLSITIQGNLIAGAYYLEPLSASVNPIGVHLQWSTYKELDVSQFVIEKSRDGMSYYEIGEAEGTGFSILDNKYHFLDMDNEAGTFFYRLRELGEDGTISYSFIATAEVLNTKPLRVLTLSLNELSGNTSITFDCRKAGNLDVYMTDITGKVVDEDTYTADLGINTLKKELDGFAKGFYILHIEFEGEHERFTLWKETEVEQILQPVATTNKSKN